MTRLSDRQKELFYSSIADSFDTLQNPFDLKRRVEVIFKELLAGEELAGKKILDVGCGTGAFSRVAHEAKAAIASLDVSFELLKQGKRKFPGRFITGSALLLPFPDNEFELVISSDVIEHTPDPLQAVAEMARVLKPGGVLALTCPNKVWQWAINLYNVIGLSSFRGFENFSGYAELEEMVSGSGFVIERHFGFHPWPFQFNFLWKLSEVVDQRFGKGLWGRIMINQAIRAHKSGLLVK